jgi:peptidoglycan/LPS O-acetylase OafA/YrhL
MEYRREVDGLRALAVLPVILFHAGFRAFGGGFVGVDVFFVISGYLITSIIVGEIGHGRFSIIDFYERRARRILPALFFVMLACLPCAWLWLMPGDMKRFASSLLAVSLFSSNLFFWSESGYFDTAAELKPLLHTWSLAVEEQYYVIFPVLLILAWRFTRRAVVAILVLIAGASLALAQWGFTADPAGAFYLLPSRGWELLVGAFVAFHLSKQGAERPPRWSGEFGGVVGVLLLVFAIVAYDEHTPFPGFYALVPVVGTALIILLADKHTFVGKLLGNKVPVGIGLVSYSAYLWHQPLFAFARHRSMTAPGDGLLAGLIIVTFLLAYLSWRFVEAPFRDRGRFSRGTVFRLSGLGGLFFMGLGLAGIQTSGFRARFDIVLPPKPWDSIKCHGAVALAQYKDPVGECLGMAGNGKARDIYLVGDSHAAQLTFPLLALARERSRDLHFINTEAATDFPLSFWTSDGVNDDRLLEHVIKVADRGDVLIIAFHRGHLNDERDKHLPIESAVGGNVMSERFTRNMLSYLPRLLGAGLTVYLVKDGPLLPPITSLEKCAVEQDACVGSLRQDQHTRSRQTKVFDVLVASNPGRVISLDILPVVYGGGREAFNPIYPDGSYKMFDRHHLTEKASMELLPYLRDSIR